MYPIIDNYEGNRSLSDVIDDLLKGRDQSCSERNQSFEFIRHVWESDNKNVYLLYGEIKLKTMTKVEPQNATLFH